VAGLRHKTKSERIDDSWDALKQQGLKWKPNVNRRDARNKPTTSILDLVAADATCRCYGRPCSLYRTTTSLRISFSLLRLRVLSVSNDMSSS